jgi:hypothetical protein
VAEFIILRKIYGPRSKSCLETLQRYVDKLAEGLDVEIRVVGQTEKGWTKVRVEGSDEVVATNYICRVFGIAIDVIDLLKVPATLTGSVIDAGKVGFGLYVDVGISKPKYVDVFIPLRKLRCQLADGAKLSARKIIQTYGILDNFPLSVRIIRVDIKNNKVEGELSDLQISAFRSWFSDGLDRVFVFGVPLGEIEETVNRLNLIRDIVKIESFGLFEQALVCKLGTTAPGIIRRLGDSLREVPLHAFSPNKIRALWPPASYNYLFVESTANAIRK